MMIGFNWTTIKREFDFDGGALTKGETGGPPTQCAASMTPTPPVGGAWDGGVGGWRRLGRGRQGGAGGKGKAATTTSTLLVGGAHRLRRGGGQIQLRGEVANIGTTS